MSANITDVTTQDEFNTILENHATVIVDFWAPWCGPCKAFAPTLEKFAEANPEVKVVKVNVDDAGELAGEYNVRSIPTIAAFKNGQLSTTKVGALSEAQLSALAAG